ncbi:nucleotidyl transferase AbiEii/AbiGii toxin family protein [Planomonospora sp. ID67723]|uniref:nucleotidyl transferase AbiEii/AbiGii toxin family protein n=1 Tax=Planomonospora sp. ID67723 TaxID=2738134 RepID=UPI0018C43C93|nr:nucleotidyl transferase AbiEii/AbiGii toxin family protein [Planomonospora sp. ID67723]MBG0828421.1 nucleotidyl transferase AbiEii/AbiGii toxin family protein [Planomonospora sp. ID67723]
MGFPPFQERILQIALPACDRFGLVLAGGHAMRVHGLTDRPSRDLDFATADERPLPDVADGMAETFRKAGLEVVVHEVTPRAGRLVVTDPVTGQSCGFDLLREALQNGPVTFGNLSVIGLEDAVGLKMRALHERSLARDVIDVAAVSELYGFRELERLARLHNEEFSLAELVMRLEFVDLIADEEFEAYGLDEERIRRIRLFAAAWVEDIKLRRAEEGDAEYDSDVPDLD